MELVEPLSDNSPVSAILKNSVQDSLYHICYSVENIEKTIENLEKQGYLKISSLDFAPAIHNRRVVFMFEKDSSKKSKKHIILRAKPSGTAGT